MKFKELVKETINEAKIDKDTLLLLQEIANALQFTSDSKLKGLERRIRMHIKKNK